MPRFIQVDNFNGVSFVSGRPLFELISTRIFKVTFEDEDETFCNIQFISVFSSDLRNPHCIRYQPYMSYKYG